ncbi:hypothetical protein [Streptomyces yangpuensis]|uniref:Uncharacterized protein n=1 Tax=Streptomyces yangpuensis TaxID=1648182 RepID=A0ABY5Q9U7_9ACTN|nr:hypothetical protein [Streptomyces yangpuensis]UUY52430.1 hypothetical protein NRK68_34790 [Streptomyces yangpuensis]
MQHPDRLRQALPRAVGGERDNDGALVAAQPRNDAAGPVQAVSRAATAARTASPAAWQRVVDGLEAVLDFDDGDELTRRPP